MRGWILTLKQEEVRPTKTVREQAKSESSSGFWLLSDLLSFCYFDVFNDMVFVVFCSGWFLAWIVKGGGYTTESKFFEFNIYPEVIMKKTLLAGLATGLFLVGTAQADQISLTGKVRDFTPQTNSDFQYRINVDPGIVATTLGQDGKPVYVGGTLAANQKTTHDAATFDQWYNQAGNSLDYSITLDNGQVGSGGVYTYSNGSFFPIDGQLLGNYQNSGHNFHFTYEINTDFTYLAGQEFTFTGDDDLWVFINDQLVIDLGGVHGAMTKTVDLDTLGLTAGQNYSFDLFFAERHTTQSNFRIDTSIALHETNPVPEPATMLLFGAGLLGLAGVARRKRS